MWGDVCSVSSAFAKTSSVSTYHNSAGAHSSRSMSKSAGLAGGAAVPAGDSSTHPTSRHRLSELQPVLLRIPLLWVASATDTAIVTSSSTVMDFCIVPGVA